jgi:hypothetical protein
MQLEILIMTNSFWSQFFLAKFDFKKFSSFIRRLIFWNQLTQLILFVNHQWIDSLWTNLR